MTPFRRTILGVLLASACWTTPAAAQSDPRAVAAEARFREGLDLFQAGDHLAACSKFEESQQLDPKLNTLLNLALCHEEIGKTASAWAEFTEAKSLARREKSEKREKFARERAEKLRPILSNVEVSYAKGAGPLPAIHLDGEPLDPELLGVAFPVDPGRHVVTARVPGAKPFEETFEVPQGPATVEVAIPTFAPDGARKPADPAPSTVPPSTVPPPTGPSSDSEATGGTLSPLVWVGFGVGGAGLVAGAITGGLALSTWADISDSCVDDRCPAGSEETLDRATLLANVSNATFVIGAAGVGLGLIGLFVLSGDDEEADAAATVTVEPWVGPTSLGLRGRF